MASYKLRQSDEAARRRLQRAYVREIKRLETMPRKAWFERDGGARLDTDRSLLRENGFTDLEFIVSGRAASLEGFISIQSGDSGIAHRIETSIRFPNDYPRSEPAAYDVAHRFKALPGKTLADRHLSEDGWCCLWLPSRTQWRPENHRALLCFMNQLVVFLERQLIYDVVKRWVGPEYPHGDTGYVYDICETLKSARLVISYQNTLHRVGQPRRRDPCPCGAAATFVECHKPAFDEITRRTPERVIERLRSAELSLIDVTIPLDSIWDPNSERFENIERPPKQ